MSVSQRELEFLLKFRADASQAVNQLRTQLQGIASQATSMNTHMAAAGKHAAAAMQSAGQSARKAHTGIHGLVGGIHQLRGALLTLGILRFGKALVDASVSTDRLNAKMLFTFKTMKGVNEQMDFTREMSNRLGINFKGTTDQFASFAAAAQSSGLEVKTLQGIFTGFSEAGAALQLSTEQMDGAFFAIQQMMSKGKVNAEEFRLQLAERMPIAMLAATRATGTTAAEFSKLLESGKLISSEFLPKMAAELQKLAAVSLEMGTQSLSASIERMKNVIYDFLVSIGNGGFKDGLKDLVNSLVGAGPALNRLGSTIGYVLGQMMHFLAAIVDIIKWLDSVTFGLSTVALGFGALRLAINLATGAAIRFSAIFGGGMAKSAASATASTGLISRAYTTIAARASSAMSTIMSITLRAAGGYAILAAAAYGSLQAVSDQEIKYMGVTVTTGEVVAERFRRLGRDYKTAALKLKEWAISGIASFLGFRDANEMVTAASALAWSDYFNTVVAGWDLLMSSIGMALASLPSMMKAAWEGSKNYIKEFLNWYSDNAPSWMGGGKLGKFEITANSGTEELKRLMAEYKKQVAGIKGKDYAASTAKGVKSALGITDADYEAVAQAKINQKLKDAIKIQDEKALQKAIEEEKKKAANTSVVIANDNSKKLRDISKASAREVSKTSEDARAAALESLKASSAIGDQWKAALMMMEDNAAKNTGQLANFFVDAFGKAEDALADFVTTGKLNISEFTSWAAKELAKIAMREAGSSLFSAAGGSTGWLGTLGTAVGILHSGGTVGSTLTPTRSVSPSLFNNAPRFHSGLKADEFPAILQRGETVVPRGKSVNSFMSGGSSVNMPVNVTVNMSGGSNGNSSAEDAKRVGSAVSEAVRTEVYSILDKEMRPGGRFTGSKGRL